MANPQKYKKYINKGKKQPISKIPFHGEFNIGRLLMLEKGILEESNVHIAVHLINKLPKKIPRYSELHKHDSNEVNLILSQDSTLTYKITLGDETYAVKSPSSVFIPKGVPHSAEVVSGKGIFICIVFDGNYAAVEP